MKRKLTWFDRIMTTITFAEANAPEIGLQYLSRDGAYPDNRTRIVGVTTPPLRVRNEKKI